MPIYQTARFRVKPESAKVNKEERDRCNCACRVLFLALPMEFRNTALVPGSLLLTGWKALAGETP